MQLYGDEVLNAWHRSIDPYCSVLRKIENRYGHLRTISPTPGLSKQEKLCNISLKELSLSLPSFDCYKELKTRIESFVKFNRMRSQEIVSRQEAASLAAGGLFYDIIKDEIVCFTCKVVLYRCVGNTWFEPMNRLIQCSHVGLLENMNLLKNLTTKMRPHAKKIDLVNLGVPEMWINVLVDLGFKMDTLLLLLLYKQYLYPHQVGLFTDIQQLLQWIISKQEEAELQFHKFHDKWPICSEELDQTVHTEPEDFVILEETQCKICFSAAACALLIPCYHFVSCQSCTRRLKCCPVCKRTVVGVTEVDFTKVDSTGSY